MTRFATAAWIAYTNCCDCSRRFPESDLLKRKLSM